MYSLHRSLSVTIFDLKVKKIHYFISILLWPSLIRTGFSPFDFLQLQKYNDVSSKCNYSHRCPSGRSPLWSFAPRVRRVTRQWCGCLVASGTNVVWNASSSPWSSQEGEAWRWHREMTGTLLACTCFSDTRIGCVTPTEESVEWTVFHWQENTHHAPVSQRRIQSQTAANDTRQINRSIIRWTKTPRHLQSGGKYDTSHSNSQLSMLTPGEKTTSWWEILSVRF